MYSKIKIAPSVLLHNINMLSKIYDNITNVFQLEKLNTNQQLTFKYCNVQCLIYH